MIFLCTVRTCQYFDKVNEEEEYLQYSQVLERLTKNVILMCLHREVNIGPFDVHRVVELLQRYSGSDPEKHALKDISYLERKCFKTRTNKKLSYRRSSDRAMRLVSRNLANCHATVQKLLIRQVLTKSMV